MGINNEWGGRHPNGCDNHKKNIISSKIMAEFSTATNLLGELKSELQASSQSPRMLILDHSINLCSAYLDTLMNEERYSHLANSAHRNALSLKHELETSIALLDDHPKPPPPTNTIESHHKHSGEVAVTSSSIHKKNDIIDTDCRATAFSNEEPEVCLKIYFFGAFKAYINREEISIWPKGKSKQLFKYLSSREKTPTPKEFLMELFWPNHSSESARNNLNVAIYSLRQSLKKILPDTSIILFKDGCYLINPKINLWVDTSEFFIHIKQASRFELHGKTEKVIAQLHKAEELYIGPPLIEDAYCSWAVELQNQTREKYRSTLIKLEHHYRQVGDIDNSISLNRKIIALDSCDENAHQHLMENYTLLGQRHLALQQFKLCEESLKRDLDLYPQQNLIDLYQQIRNMKTA